MMGIFYVIQTALSRLSCHYSTWVARIVLTILYSEYIHFINNIFSSYRKNNLINIMSNCFFEDASRTKFRDII